jgi:hypothetical protein
MKGEVVITLESLGSRWVVWAYFSHEDEALQYVTAALGEAPTIGGAKTIAGLFGAATANAVYQVAKDADKLREIQSGVYNAAGVVDLTEVQSAYARANYDARQAARHLERLTRTAICSMCDGTNRTARYGRESEGEPHIVREQCPHCR